MKSLLDWILWLSLLAALVSIVCAGYALFPRPSTSVKWRREGSITGLALGIISWLSAIGIIIIGKMRWDALGPLIPGLLLVGVFTNPVAFVFGIATRGKPGFLLAIAEAAQGLFWLAFWISISRGIL